MNRSTLLPRLMGLVLLAMSIAFVPTGASAHEACDTPEDIPIVIEFGSLGGEDQVVCAQHAAGTTATEALAAAGVDTEDTRASQPMLCRIEGRPDASLEKCGDSLSGKGYWAFLVAKEGQKWGYATSGLADYTLADGEFVALVYHLLADGENVPVEHAASAKTRAAAVVAGHDEGAGHDTATENDDLSPTFSEIALPVAIVAAVLVAGAAVVVARRGRSQD